MPAVDDHAGAGPHGSVAGAGCGRIHGVQGRPGVGRGIVTCAGFAPAAPGEKFSACPDGAGLRTDDAGRVHRREGGEPVFGYEINFPHLEVTGGEQVGGGGEGREHDARGSHATLAGGAEIRRGSPGCEFVRGDSAWAILLPVREPSSLSGSKTSEPVKRPCTRPPRGARRSGGVDWQLSSE